MNYPSEDVPFTRITEFKQLTGQTHARTSIVHEYPEAEGDPYYPVPRPENQALFKRYEALAMTTPGVTFVGRRTGNKFRSKSAHSADRTPASTATRWVRRPSSQSV